MSTYKNMPQELYDIVKLFCKNRLKYNLFKCEHIFDGVNSNLDILFLKIDDYEKASRILEKRGFVSCMSEWTERYKRMYVKVIGTELFAIHLHREVAWHSLKILEKDNIFRRQKKADECIFVPSDEDSLIIHAAHIIFEDLMVGNRERKIINSLLKKKLDWNYINRILKRSGFRGAFDYIVKKRGQPSKKVLIRQLIKKIIFSPMSWPFVGFKIIRFILRKINPFRKGCLIALIGVNGSGKTTLTKKTLDEYNKITKFFNGQFGYYFGWEPFSFYAKLIAKLFRKKNKRTFDEVNYGVSGKKQRFSLFKEFVFVYNYFEFLWRYLFVIYPKLRNNKLVITDRYFYDIYGQYNYAPRSRLIKILFALYPKPNFLFVLNTDAKTARTRGKSVEMFSRIKKSSKRKLIDLDVLKAQIKRYLFLSKYFNGTLINTNKDISNNIVQIIQKSWVRLVR